jgi:hypothetical protein
MATARREAAHAAGREQIQGVRDRRVGDLRLPRQLVTGVEAAVEEREVATSQ